MKCDELKPVEFWTKQFYLIKDVDESIAELKEELSKQWDYHKRMEKCWLENDRINRRSLWLARAYRAKTEMYAACGNGDIYLAWEKVKRLCMNKAEEYK